MWEHSENKIVNRNTQLTREYLFQKRVSEGTRRIVQSIMVVVRLLARLFSASASDIGIYNTKREWA